MKAWNIKQLHEAHLADLALCHTATERQMCSAISGAEIRKCAEEFASYRRLTPGEIAIAEMFGYRG